MNFFKERKPRRKILCFGDSLTEGFWMNGFKFHPYSLRLTQCLKENNIKDVECVTAGVSGERSTSMVGRLPRIIQKDKFMIAIILGGTNDLPSLEAEKIFANITTLHKQAHEKGIQTIAVTLPELKFKYESKMNARVDEKVVEVNKLIKEFANENEKVILFDLCEFIPNHSLSPEERKLLWDDGVHFTPQGYDKIGQKLFEIISPLL